MATIRAKVKVLFLAVCLGAALSMAYGISIGHKNKQEMIAVQSDIRSYDRDIQNLVHSSTDMKMDVVQVQQFLSDIGATRGLDGLDDGFKGAEKYAQDFKKDVAEGIEIAARMGAKDIENILRESSASFDPFYSMGQVMARTYIAEGPAGGNKLMGQFDSTSARLAGDLEKVGVMTRALAEKRMEDVNKSIDKASEDVLILGRFLNLMSGGAIVLLFFIALFIFKIILSPLRDMTGVMTSLAGGNLTVDVHGTRKADEIGDIARAVQVFKENMCKTVELMKINETERLAKEESNRKMSVNLDTLEKMITAVLTGMEESDGTLKRIAMDVDGATAAVKSQIDEMSTSSEEASLNVQMVSSAAEELSLSIQGISAQMTESLKISEEARGVADGTTREIQALEEKVSRIDNVVKLITDIAEQTNLLALNATIEAARAGDAGKGFAVVASEVKGLANQTAKATEEISLQIKEVKASTQTAAEAIRGISSIIRKVTDFSASSAASIGEQNIATSEIARNSLNAADKVSQVSSVAAVSVETTKILESTVEDVKKQSRDLSQQTSEFSAEITGFLSRMRG